MTTTPDPDAERRDQVRGLVDRAVMAVLPPHSTYERKLYPESTYGITTPYPLAGLQAALVVAAAAQQKAYDFAKELRGEGSTWAEIADLLGIEWSPDYHRLERAYELVAGPSRNRRGAYADVRLYWTCAGDAGCGQYITDRGPYDAHPNYCEQGHAEGCSRHANDVARYVAECEERDRRDEVMRVNRPKVTDPFGQETVERVRYVLEHGGRWLGWSTSECLAVALVLRDKEALEANGYPTEKEAMERILSGMGRPPTNPRAWLRLLRLAATGDS
jgi:hypothetical protein